MKNENSIFESMEYKSNLHFRKKEGKPDWMVWKNQIVKCYTAVMTSDLKRLQKAQVDKSATKADAGIVTVSTETAVAAAATKNNKTECNGSNFYNLPLKLLSAHVWCTMQFQICQCVFGQGTYQKMHRMRMEWETKKMSGLMWWFTFCPLYTTHRTLTYTYVHYTRAHIRWVHFFQIIMVVLECKCLKTPTLSFCVFVNIVFNIKLFCDLQLVLHFSESNQTRGYF